MTHAGPELHIHPDAIRHNLSVLRHHLKSYAVGQTPARIWAVAKSDAYGHGLIPTLRAFDAADGLAVSSADDAAACRAAGWHKPILLLGAGLDLTTLSGAGPGPLHVVVSNPEQVNQLEHNTKLPGLYIWLRYAGSLNHAGFKPADYAPTWHRLAALHAKGRIAGLGHFQHYAYAEDAAHLLAERRQFRQTIFGLSGPVCSENSAATLNGPDVAATTQWVRSGIILYGVNPLGRHHKPGLALRPAMTLKARIHAIQQLEPGEAIGYGCTARARGPMRVGLVHCGYGHGYPRTLSTPAPCSIRGRKAHLFGRVSMDTLTIDITAQPDIQPGDVVTLWGDHTVPVDHVAQAADTIPAQLFTAITPRVRRYYPGDPGYQEPTA
ncbi:MAG TPA: alanine racemase [Burkholderiaceae bacterium]|nr:alanine racemase [Burkholderiaceae bacterium]